MYPQIIILMFNSLDDNLYYFVAYKCTQYINICFNLRGFYEKNKSFIFEKSLAFYFYLYFYFILLRFYFI